MSLHTNTVPSAAVSGVLGAPATQSTPDSAVLIGILADRATTFPLRSRAATRLVGATHEPIATTTRPFVPNAGPDAMPSSLTGQPALTPARSDPVIQLFSGDPSP